MGQYVIRRLLHMIPLILGVTVLTFLIMQLAPGSPVDVMVDPLVSTPEGIAALEASLGLDKPPAVQYFYWMRQLARGNFGYSFLTGRPVLQLIAERLPSTLTLTVAALSLAFAAAVPVGLLSALRRGSWIDRVATGLAFAGISTPQFFLSLLIVYIVSLRLRLLPSSGYGSVGLTLTGWAAVRDRLPYLILPTLALAIQSMAGVVRYTRSAVIDVMAEDYIRTARAKGLSERVVIYKHALRNSLLPVITMMGLMMPMVFGGAFVIEYIFDWPGMGTLAVRSVRNREYSIIMALNLVTACMVLVGNLTADILYAVSDPRITYD